MPSYLKRKNIINTINTDLGKVKHFFIFVDCFQEYIQDGIDWAKVEFEDNQDCLNLFEKVQYFVP
jgi:myosin heavy subunit